MQGERTYKQTSIGLIPSDWEVKKLGDIFIFKNGLNKEKEFFGYGTPIVNYMDVFKNNYLTKNIVKGKVSVNSNELKNFEVKKGDVFFTRTSETIEEIGMSSVVIEEVENTVFSGFVLRARPINNSLDTVFCVFCFSSENVRREITKKSTHTTRALTNGTLLSEVQLPIPPLPEQQKIAQILSTWDAAIDNCKAIINNLQERNKGLAQQLLTGKMRVQGFEKTKWNEIKLGDVFKERNECNQNALQLLSIGERGIYPQDEDNKRNISNSDKSKYKKICVGDIGYNTMRMWQGRCAKSSYEGIVSPAYTIVVCKPNHSVNFYAYLFKQSFMMHKFFRVSQGLVEDTLNCKYKDFSIVSVNIPSNIEEQKAIANILDTANKVLNQYQQQLQTLQQQKKGLMQQLLTGRVRVKI